VLRQVLQARGSELDLIRELPSGPAACEPHQRPHTCQTLTTRCTDPKILLASRGASTHVANFLFRSFSDCSLGSGTEGGVFKGRHFDRSVILLRVRWYLAYNLSLRNLEEMMAERGIFVDHATVHRWVVRYSPELLERFNRCKRPTSGKWHVDETLYLMGVAGHSHSMRPG